MGMLAIMKRAGAAAGILGFLRKRGWPCLEREEYEDWIENRDALGIHWYEIEECGHALAVAGWRVYSIYKRNVILELFALIVKEENRRKGLGTRLFNESLNAAIEALEAAHFTVEAFQIETVVADAFYRKVLSRSAYPWKTAWKYERRQIAGREIVLFWVPLITSKGQV